jgi:hypothetical protein
MSLSLSKAKTISGAAVLAALLAGCGGGGGSGSPAGSSLITEGSTRCAATNSAVTVDANVPAVLGSCEQYEASVFPTKVATAFRDSGQTLPVLFNSVSNAYSVNLPLLAANITLGSNDRLNGTGGGTALSFGDYAGITYQSADRTSGAATTVYDYVKTTDTSSSTYLDLNFSRFGIFSRFADRTLGYYGGWSNGIASSAPFPTGLVTFRGALVGVLGPNANNNAAFTAVGISTPISITVDFSAAGAARPVTAITLGGFRYSQNGGFVSVTTLSTEVAAGSTSSLDATSQTKKLALNFATSTTAVGANGLSTVKLEGNFYGSPSGALSEIVGNIKFITADGRNGIGAFGVRSGATIVGAP